MIQYETERLYLRDFEENDLEAVYDYAGSFENTTYLMWGPHSREEVKAFIDDAICSYESDDRDNRPHAKWAVVLKDKFTWLIILKLRVILWSCSPCH